MRTNGRLHRRLIHHVLATAGYNSPGVVFLVSAAIYREIPRYTAVLESYSRPLLEFIEWEATSEGNVRVLNDTADYYRYFDATPRAEFLYGCVEETVNQDLPQELAYLEAYDRFSRPVQGIVDMPDRQVNLLHRFLIQGKGPSFQARAHGGIRGFDGRGSRANRAVLSEIVCRGFPGRRRGRGIVSDAVVSIFTVSGRPVTVGFSETQVSHAL